MILSTMTPEQVIKHFGTQDAVAEALTSAHPPVTQPAISQWLKDGRVPDLRQYQIQVITAGKLVAKPNNERVAVQPAPSLEN